MIVTFYSYKGGVGRSMALVNVGQILADLGCEVILCDWDLEAPGLERFFVTEGDEIERRRQLDLYRSRPGIIDLVLEYKAAMTDGPATWLPLREPAQEHEFVQVGELRLRRPSSFAFPILPNGSAGNQLRLLSAGRREASSLDDYLQAVRTLDWRDFYYSWSGDAYLEFVRKDLEDGTSDQRIVLIDSRTGITEIGGMCTHHLADLVVLLTAPNETNLEGIRRIAEVLGSGRLRALRGNRPLGVLPVAARVEQGAQGKELQDFRERFAADFIRMVPKEVGAPILFLENAEIPYKPYFSFHEQITSRKGVLKDRELYNAYQYLAATILKWGAEVKNLRFPASTSPIAALVRSPGIRPGNTSSRQLREHDRLSFGDSRWFLSYSAQDRPLAEAVACGLSAAGIPIWCDVLEDALPHGETWVGKLQQALEQSAGYLLLVGPRPVESWVRVELDYALRLQGERAHTGKAFALVPLLHAGAVPGSLAGLLGSFVAIDLPDGIERAGPEVFAQLAEELRGVAQSRRIPPPAEVCPFPGMESFDEDRVRFFFGRDSETRELCARLGDTPAGHRRWLQVEGPTGSGKSSLVRAGFIPALQRRWVEGTPQMFQIAVLRPGAHPILSLSYALYRALRGALDEGWTLARTKNTLEASPDALKNLLREHSLKHHGFLLVIDQLEEAFMLAGDDRSAVRQFDALLARALEDKAGPVYLVTTIRTDFVARFGELPELEKHLNDAATARYHLQPMAAESLRLAIEGPAGVARLQWEAGLPERLVKDALSSEGGLPLVAHVLVALWNTRERGTNMLSFRAYEALGGLVGALTTSADGVVDALGEDGKEKARRLLMRLVKPGRGTADTRQTVRRAEALAAAGGGEEAERILARLSGGRDPDKPDQAASMRLIVVSGEPGSRVDLVHEALLQQWKRLREWIDESRKALERRDDLEAAAQAWEAAGRPRDGLPGGAQLAYLRGAEAFGDQSREFLEAAVGQERRRLRRARLVVGALAAGLVLMSGLGVFADIQRREAERQRALAESRLKEAIEVADEVVFTIDRELQPIAGAADVRKKLLGRAAELQNRLLEGQGDSLEALRSRMANHNQRGDLATTHDDLARAREEYEAGLRIALHLVERDPQRTELRRNLSVSYNKLGGVMEASGDLAAARNYYEKALELSKQLCDADPQNAGLRRDLSVSYNNLGDVAKESGNLSAAREYYDKDLELTKTLSEADPQNAALRRDLWVSYNKLGEVAQASGDLAAAGGYYEKGLELTKALSEADLQNASLRRDLSVSYNKLGDVAQASGDLAAARGHYEKALELTKALSEADPQNAGLRGDLSISYNNLGDVAQASGDLAAARGHYEKALELTKALSEADLQNASLRRDLSVSYNKLGDVAQASGDLAAARGHYEKALELTKALSEADPQNAGLRGDLSISYNNLGEVAQASGDLAAARGHYEKALELKKALSAADPQNADWQFGLVLSHGKLMELARSSKDPVAFRTHREEALRIMSRLEREGRMAGHAQFAQVKKYIETAAP